MSDSNPSTAPVARTRPSTVTIAGYLLYAVAAIQVVQLIISLSVLGTFNDVFDEAYAGTDMADAGAVAGTASLVGGAVVGLLVAIGLVVLALLNNRGKNPARIVTWILGGLFFCCTVAGLGLTAAGNALAPASNGDPNVPDQAEIQRMLDERLPGWFTPVTTVLSIVGVIAVLVALILLALPPSNEFFRKPQPVWEPPVPGSAYPGYPSAGYPQSGHPQSGPPQAYPGSSDPTQQYSPPSGESTPPTAPAAPTTPAEPAPPPGPASTSDDEPGQPPSPRSGSTS